jgi:hypothetical protein
MEAAGEPEESFETCATNSDLLTETAPRPPGSKGSMGLVATACGYHGEAVEVRLPIQYELTLALVGRVSRSLIPVLSSTGRKTAS